MKDREFLKWLHERLEKVHKEDPCVDYMHKLRAIIIVHDKDVDTNWGLVDTSNKLEII